MKIIIMNHQLVSTVSVLIIREVVLSVKCILPYLCYFCSICCVHKIQNTLMHYLILLDFSFASFFFLSRKNIFLLIFRFLCMCFFSFSFLYVFFRGEKLLFNPHVELVI